MKKESSRQDYPYRNIKTGESVNLSPDDVARAASLWDDPVFVLRFIDMVCGFDDPDAPKS